MKRLNLAPCIPPAWAKSGHAQTLMGHFLPSKLHREQRERFEVLLPDGDRLVGSFFRGTSRTTVTVFHGLTGDIESNYMQRTASLARVLGHSVLLMNHRGCGEGRGLAINPYHSGRAEDLSAVFAKLKTDRPNDQHIGVGFSLGANALLLLGAQGDEYVKPDAALAFNAPIHLEDAALRLKIGLNRIYDLQFVMECRKATQIEFPRFGTVHDFDNAYTAPASGFKNREHYYSTCSTYDKLDRISVPTLIVTAADDPFVNVNHYKTARLSPHVQLHIESHGGHMGYLTHQATTLGTRRWLDYALHEALAAFT